MTRPLRRGAVPATEPAAAPTPASAGTAEPATTTCGVTIGRETKLCMPYGSPNAAPAGVSISGATGAASLTRKLACVLLSLAGSDGTLIVLRPGSESIPAVPPCPKRRGVLVSTPV